MHYIELLKANKLITKSAFMITQFDTGAAVPSWLGGLGSLLQMFPTAYSAKGFTVMGFPVYIIPVVEICDSLTIYDLPVSVLSVDASVNLILSSRCWYRYQYTIFEDNRIMNIDRDKLYAVGRYKDGKLVGVTTHDRREHETMQKAQDEMIAYCENTSLLLEELSADLYEEAPAIWKENERYTAQEVAYMYWDTYAINNDIIRL